jgi:hypothetical protein
VLGGGSDWVFSVRSYGQFLSSVIAGRVINLGLWKAMQDPSCLPSVFESPPLDFPRLSTLSSHPYGMVSAKANSPHTLPTDEIWYKPGDGEWSKDLDFPCDRVTDPSLLSPHADPTPDASGQPACVGGEIGTHAEWLLAGSTIAVVFVNSCLDPQAVASKTSWSPVHVLHGAIMSAFNSADWEDL